jgi:hypothetical protein
LTSNRIQFLARRASPERSAHIWLGDDTACRLWSTGGITQRHKYEVIDTPRAGDLFAESERKICPMCLAKQEN